MPEAPLNISLTSSSAVSLTSVSGVSGNISGPFDAHAIEIPDVMAGSFVARVTPPETALQPDDVSDLTRWYDVSQLVGLNDGDLISTMPNLAPVYTTVYLAGGSGAREPIYRTNIQNGLPGAEMGGGSFLYFVTNGAIPIPAQTILVVYRLTGAAFGPSNGNMASIGGGGGQNWMPTDPGTTQFLAVAGTTLNLNGAANPSRTAIFGQAAIYGAEAATVINEMLMIGDGAGRAPNGYFMEVVTYSRPLTNEEFSGLVDGFAQKWGISI